MCNKYTQFVKENNCWPKIRWLLNCDLIPMSHITGDSHSLNHVNNAKNHLLNHLTCKIYYHFRFHKVIL